MGSSLSQAAVHHKALVATETPSSILLGQVTPTGDVGGNVWSRLSKFCNPLFVFTAAPCLHRPVCVSCAAAGGLSSLFYNK